MASVSGTPSGMHHPPYSSLAIVYDHIMMHVNYRKWAKYIRKIIKRHGVAGQGKLLDIGCGTGRFIQELKRHGTICDGCDPSLHMLKVAKGRLPEHHFYQDQLPGLKKTAADQYSVFTCLYDTMNYLGNEVELLGSLQRTFELLPAGGLFVFDVVTDVHCQQYFQDFEENEVIDKEYAYDRKSHYDQAKGLQYNTIKIYTPRGTFTEEHQQTIFSIDRIIELIETQTGFQIAGQYEDFTFDAPDQMSGRIHFVLGKQ